MTNEELISTYRTNKESKKMAKALLDELVQQNKKLIYYFASRYVPLLKNNRYDLDDLVQEGWIAFLRSVDGFEIGAENLFSTYAGTNIRFAILNFINHKAIDRKKKNDEERIQLISMDASLKDIEDFTIADTIEDVNAQEAFCAVDFETDTLILRSDLLDVMDAVFEDNPSPTDALTMKNVLLLRYGLNSHSMRFEAIAIRFNTSRQWVVHLHNKGIWEIRKSHAAAWLLKKYRNQIVQDIEAIGLEVKNVEKHIEIDDMVDKKIEAIDDFLNSILDDS